MLHLLAPLALLGATALSAPAPGPAADGDLPFRVSLYYVAVEEDYPAGRDSGFRDAGGRLLYPASPDFVAAAAVEGAARTEAGASLVFDPANPDRGWSWSDAPYGIDALGCPLIPFRSAAAPPWIPLGTRLFIAETVGLPLPDGGRHDGIWYATDRGVGITGDRIDLFMRLGETSMRQGEQFGLDYLKPVRVRLLGPLGGCPEADEPDTAALTPPSAAPASPARRGS